MEDWQKDLKRGLEGLEARSKALDKREEALDSREGKLAKQEKTLLKRERELSEREKQTDVRLSSVNETVEQLKTESESDRKQAKELLAEAERQQNHNSLIGEELKLKNLKLDRELKETKMLQKRLKDRIRVANTH